MWAAALLVAAGLGYWWYQSRPAETDSMLLATIKEGPFQVSVQATGELIPKKEKKIMGPSGLQQLEIWQVRVNTLVPEGTIVKEGDFVADLDQSTLLEKLTQKEGDLTRANAQFLQARLDTTLELRKLRDDMSNQELVLVEKKATLEQSKYEPPATIRLAELDLEKARKNLSQMRIAYKLQKEKAQAKMDEVGVSVSSASGWVKAFKEVLGKMTIKSSGNGMVVYRKDWSGRRVESGSEIGTWDLTVATLPDLSTLSSRTYVNETDINRVKMGQGVQIALDALPGKKLKGKVTSVSNIGEQRPGSDAKVYEVLIELESTDSKLRPAMTTANTIISQTVPKALRLPLDALHQTAKGEEYVLTRTSNGSLERRQVKTGLTNENEAEVLAGLEKGQQVALAMPEEVEKLPFIALPKGAGDDKKPAPAPEKTAETQQQAKPEPKALGLK